MTHPTFTVEIGDAPGLEPASWIDVSDRFLDPESDSGSDFSYTYGRGDELANGDTGVASFTLDNWDGNWELGIAPGTAVRVIATVASTTYPVLYGVVESAPAVWPHKGLDAVVDVRVADGMTLLARSELGEMTRPSELTGDRIAGLLDTAGWPAALRQIDSGRVYIDELGEYDADGELQDTIVNGLQAIREAVEAEQGQCYIAPDGSFVFHDRLSRIGLEFGQIYGGGYLSGYETGGTGAATTFGGAGLDYDNLVPRYDDATLWTVGRAEMSDGTVIEYDDATAVATYGRRVYVLRDLPISDLEAEVLTAWMVVRYANPARRYDRLEIEAATEAELTAVLTLRPGDVIRVQSDAIGGGAAVDEYVHVEKIDHRVGSNLWWSTFHLSPYFGDGPWLVLDDPTKGILDGTRTVAP
jgi:hypothetical protein